MSQNITLNDTNYTGITKLKALKTGSSNYAEFVDTSDANAVASEIASGKTAYVNGVKLTGTHSCDSTPTLQTKTVTPTTSQQTISADSGYDGLSSVTVSAVTSSIDSNIVAGNIKKDVSILGVTGTYEASGGDSSNVLMNMINNTTTGDLVIPEGVTRLALDFLAYEGIKGVNVTYPSTLKELHCCFSSAYKPMINAIPTSLERIDGNYALGNCTYTSSCSTIDLPNLRTVMGNYMFYQASGTNNITSVKFGANTGFGGTGEGIGIGFFNSGMSHLTDVQVYRGFKASLHLGSLPSLTKDKVMAIVNNYGDCTPWYHTPSKSTIFVYNTYYFTVDGTEYKWYQSDGSFTPTKLLFNKTTKKLYMDYFDDYRCEITITECGAGEGYTEGDKNVQLTFEQYSPTITLNSSVYALLDSTDIATATAKGITIASA